MGSCHQQRIARSILNHQRDLDLLCIMVNEYGGHAKLCDKPREGLELAFLLVLDKLSETADDPQRESQEAAQGALNTPARASNNTTAPVAREQGSGERVSPASISIFGETASNPICQYDSRSAFGL